MLEIAILFFFLAMFTAIAMRCAGLSFVPLIKKTFAPFTRHDFLFPPCAFCWAARAAAVVLIFSVVDRYVYQF